jgi:hypothetical protein
MYPRLKTPEVNIPANAKRRAAYLLDKISLGERFMIVFTYL